MPKLKTSKAIAKRVKISSTGKYLRHKASKSHLLQKKSSKRRRSLSSTCLVDSRDIKNIAINLPYS
uniref:50S ribosomal protein L35 n=1 Tax=Pyropia perforata TaxID=182771 RepID=A0A023HQR1_PYRPE|nr:50S ribosomal protein L35 [Neoporphyra perforata]AGQ17092.1 50S ribosomal protein L35 [Neoporphyra perforata]AHB35048.1 50S ribosomal protein L35 [Neoporphyra perforata]AHB35257.1 50S ribosomal protein L35 [Neoporphyra perforata]AIA19419.1 50S ribosomal protein L35 [Neoporphyra perforata]AIA19628.1 50S ribosomal protein L35 [Neoporphyra perforata]